MREVHPAERHVGCRGRHSIHRSARGQVVACGGCTRVLIGQDRRFAAVL